MTPGAASIRAAGWARRRGFTLLELVVVLAIAGLLMAATPPLLSRALPGLQLKGAAREVAAALREARTRAISQRRETYVEIDLEGREASVSGGGKHYRFSDDLDFTLVTAERELVADGHAGRVRFYPDGTSTGARLTIRYEDGGYDVDVDWLTGRIAITSFEPRHGG